MGQEAGKFYLVSAGIGDTDNITLRAYKLIQQADIVLAMPFVSKLFADVLAGKEVHDPGHAFFIDADFNTAQDGEEDKIRQLIRGAVGQGKIVVVMDFGDPTIYSPQSGYLREFADLNPEVVPGISSFNAANAALGQEITGNYDHPVVLSEVMEYSERLDQLAASGATLILFSMRMDLADTIGQLKKHYPGDTPAVIVCHAGLRETQFVLRATLDSIVEEADKQQPLPWDHLLYVGEGLRR
ncbi:Precorrin-4 C(11)-methyltransferase [Vibrio quintilis]|uniref:Precorrin-4 C(11)-methyltransferase n=2 Tax=Vibrio quintilis TaxID=1117707 RepID=A0A1M7YU14_9VIBR|nr:Precorrin-4 C(11)-methyltransferase [Vibrio quintilis]